MKKIVFFLISIFLLGSCRMTDSPDIPERGVTSNIPAEKWDYGFLTGNGKTGVLVYGKPLDETIVFNHERLYLPHEYPPVVDLGKTYPEVLKLLAKKGYQEAQDYSMKVATDQGHFNYHSDPFHYAFELKLGMPGHGEIKDYLRSTDFRTGEVVVRWDDETGSYTRKLFVSRADNVTVMSVRGPGRKKLDMTITPSPIKHDLIRSGLNVGKELIIYHNAYLKSKGGYDNVVRIIARGGKQESDGKAISVKGATEVTIIAGIEWHEQISENSAESLVSKISALPGDYEKLLEPHSALHGEIFNRVALDLGGGEDRRLTSEELISRAKESEFKNIPPALIEKMYDASRYYFICSAGDWPPNLQGKWNGEFTAPWNGSYTFDTNVQNAMDGALSGNMPEGMESLFNMVETYLPDWRTNAKMLFGARGALGQIVSSPNSGLAYHYERGWTWQFWTAGTPWLASYFYDYYLFTGDRDFLARRAYPFMKEIALFFEDFLKEKDENGHYIYRFSESPEVRDGPWLMTRDNSTFNISIAKELLRNVISAAVTLNTDLDLVPVWQELHDNLPPYQIGPDGDLAEWNDGKFSHLYNHRHHSPFYPLFRSFEFSPDSTPELWEASKIALSKKGDQWLRNKSADWWGIPFGRSFHAQAASYLGNAKLVEEVINSMADRVYPSLFMSLGPDGNIFNFDGVGAYPDIINRSLAFSLNGTLDLLRSVPPGWQTGRISGILTRGQLHIDRLEWDLNAGKLTAEITSAIPQVMIVRIPGSSKITAFSTSDGTPVEAEGLNPNARKVSLPGGKKVMLEIGFEPGLKPL